MPGIGDDIDLIVTAVI